MIDCITKEELIDKLINLSKKANLICREPFEDDKESQKFHVMKLLLSTVINTVKEKEDDFLEVFEEIATSAVISFWENYEECKGNVRENPFVKTYINRLSDNINESIKRIAKYEPLSEILVSLTEKLENLRESENLLIKEADMLRKIYDQQESRILKLTKLLENYENVTTCFIKSFKGLIGEAVRENLKDILDEYRINLILEKGEK